jgi:23S rRNA (cytidine2498-2'-O)-methyltransferase
VWQRDARVPGDRGFEPGITPLAGEIAAAIAAAKPAEGCGESDLIINRKARPGDLVLDCVVVEPGEWWVGRHRAASVPARFPGGVCVTPTPADVVSRAFWKMREALAWSQLPVKMGDRCAEIGSAPGGSSQALLEAGLQVVGIDPADMDESLADHPHFTHVRKRAADMKRREFRGVRWLMADSNVAPKHTLDTVEAIVTNGQVHVRGMLLTLKLLDWQLAAMIPEYLARIRSWGFGYVRARQLSFNRQEICVAALRTRSMRREPPRRRRMRGAASSSQSRGTGQAQDGRALVNGSCED